MKKFFRMEDRIYKTNFKDYEDGCDDIFTKKAIENGERLSTGEASQSQIINETVKEDQNMANLEEQDNDDESEDISVESKDDDVEEDKKLDIDQELNREDLDDQKDAQIDKNKSSSALDDNMNQVKEIEDENQDLTNENQNKTKLIAVKASELNDDAF